MSERAQRFQELINALKTNQLRFTGRFDKYPVNYYMYGRVEDRGVERMDPSTKPVDTMRPYKRHARLLQRLKESGALKNDIEGLTWYSWKDTGISMHARKTGPMATKDQAGHRNLAMTSIYYHAAETNPEYMVLDNDLLS